MKAISLFQPWATLIMLAYKPYPNPHHQSPRKQVANRLTRALTNAFAGSIEVRLKNLRVDQMNTQGTPITRPMAIMTSTISTTPLPSLDPT
jgi:hypothetical protein